MESKYMKFRIFEKLEKTNIWKVTSKSSGNCLGFIKWYNPWRQYCFSSWDDSTFNDGCLQDIIHFLQNKNDIHKIKRKHPGDK